VFVYPSFWAKEHSEIIDVTRRSAVKLSKADEKAYPNCITI